VEIEPPEYDAHPLARRAFELLRGLADDDRHAVYETLRHRLADELPEEVAEIAHALRACARDLGIDDHSVPEQELDQLAALVSSDITLERKFARASSRAFGDPHGTLGRTRSARAGRGQNPPRPRLVPRADSAPERHASRPASIGPARHRRRGRKPHTDPLRATASKRAVANGQGPSARRVHAAGRDPVKRPRREGSREPPRISSHPVASGRRYSRRPSTGGSEDSLTPPMRKKRAAPPQGLPGSEVSGCEGVTANRNVDLISKTAEYLLMAAHLTPAAGGPDDGVAILTGAFTLFAALAGALLGSHRAKRAAADREQRTRRAFIAPLALVGRRLGYSARAEPVKSNATAALRIWCAASWLLGLLIQRAQGVAGGLGLRGAMLVLRGRQPKGVSLPHVHPSRPPGATASRGGRSPVLAEREASSTRFSGRRASSCAARPTARAMG
jgi:hypothetical protein